MSKTIIEWTYKLQYSLDQMTSDEVNEFLKDKAIRYEGKLYTIGEENAEGKNSQVKRKTNRASKRSSIESKSVWKN